MPTIPIEETNVLSPENEPLVISLYTFDRMLKEDDGENLFVLYTFLYRHTRRQRTNSVWCTPKYIGRGLSWSESKVHRVKKRLEELGFITLKQTFHSNGSFAKQFIRVNFVYSPNPANAEDLSGVSNQAKPGCQKHGDGEFDTPKYSINSKHINSPESPPRETTGSKGSVEQQSSESGPPSEDEFDRLPRGQQLSVLYEYYVQEVGRLQRDAVFRERSDKKRLDYYLLKLSYQGTYQEDIQTFLTMDLSWMKLSHPYGIPMFVSWVEKGRPAWKNFTKDEQQPTPKTKEEWVKFQHDLYSKEVFKRIP